MGFTFLARSMFLFYFYIYKDEGIIKSKVNNQFLSSILGKEVGSYKSVSSMALLVLSISFLFKILLD